MKRRKEKKSESLDIRLPFEQKREFMDATRKRGESAAKPLQMLCVDLSPPISKRRDWPNNLTRFRRLQ